MKLTGDPIWLSAVLHPTKCDRVVLAVLITGSDQRAIVACHFEPMR
jgi:hypothetical protein